MMQRKYIVLLAVMMLLMVGTAFSVQASGISSLDEGKFYTSQAAHERLGTIDLESGVGTDIGPYTHRDLEITRTGWPAVNGAVYKNKFYVILNKRLPADATPDQAEAHLAQVNPRTGKVKLVGSPINLNLGGIEISYCGEMFATGFSLTNGLGHLYGDTNLYRVDRKDGSLTLIGDTGIERIMDLAFDPAGNLWGTVGNVLYTLDLETGTPTEMAQITGTGVGSDGAVNEIMGIGFTSQGELFGTAPFSDKLYSLDPQTGMATEVGTHGFVIPHGGDIPMIPHDMRCQDKDDDD
jgi:hypothetical protein